MDQLSLFSAEARHPRVADLAGLLCGQGQAVGFGRGTAARLSVVVADTRRTGPLVTACAERGVEAEVSGSEAGTPLVRTAFRSDLTELAGHWLRGAVKSVPSGFAPDGAALRIWVLTSGHPDGDGYLLGLDPHAPDTYEPLTSALSRVGLPAKLIGPRGGGPALRLAGKRRLRRLAELVGPCPAASIGGIWPPRR
ncbi:hypothetical protein FHX42_003931 [Saccharopolyspora lacisalsi]|uniref:Uncharacterized protein n=1 Tax=Halosaccharopolyspora lacisalsi TaxID=1000566 RepID=A0A839DX60_9PSEU|nr:hypothetical protein [Halosaccharopolyspora lacisalsi]MBA8826552.1 hypothetical protein [Halosaccharopolyspora lacisalsi]